MPLSVYRVLCWMVSPNPVTTFTYLENLNSLQREMNRQLASSFLTARAPEDFKRSDGSPIQTLC